MEPLFADMEEERVYMQSYYQQVYCFYGFGTWLITLKNGKILGRAGIEVNENGEFVLGYMLAPEYQHQGYALEACLGILKFAEDTLELDRREITAYIHSENEPSVRLAKKLGVRIEFIKET